MKRSLILWLFMLGCGNKVEVPSQVTTIQCIQDAQGKCTTSLDVKHIISLELPTVLTDQCKIVWNETDYPDKTIREAGYNKCISDYINSLLELIKGINPTDLPPFQGG